MTPRMKKAMAAIRKEIASLPHDHQNNLAIEGALNSCLQQIKELRTSDHVVVPKEVVELLRKTYDRWSTEATTRMDKNKKALLRDMKRLLNR